ncbi:vWA domain-containing protein [Persicimonas caeni]|nr:vWA domain-containing protein [Persicimonas caeni]
MGNQRFKQTLLGAVTLGTFLAFAPSAHADGEWKAPDVTILLGADIFSGGQTDKSGPMLNTTISNYWEDGACTYDQNGVPSSDCDRLRFGLTMFRGPNTSNNICPDPIAPLSPPQEDGGGQLTTGGPYHVAQLQSDAGDLYCDDFKQRTLGEAMLEYRDNRFNNELGTNWPDRPQLTLQLIKNLPQTNNATQDQVREALLAACELYQGNGGQHLSLPTWVMTSPLADADAELFGGMLAAAGGTGQCCYKPAFAGSCDPTDSSQTLDMCEHLLEQNSSGIVHTETRLRSDIDDAKYNCTATGKPAAPGAMKHDKFSDMKCNLQGSPCSGNHPGEPAYLWPVFSCIQLRPSNIPPDQLSVEYCGEIDGEPIDASHGDKDGDGCITLTPGNGIEFVDENKNLYYVSQGGSSLCQSIGSGDSTINVNCPNLNELCDLNDGSQCTLGQYQCINNRQVCERFPGNDSCDSAACGQEQVHDVGLVQPNVQFVVDRSGSMSGNRWTSAEQVTENLATWSYEGAGCEDDGTYCDKVRLGVHFWSSYPAYAYGAQEDMTGTMIDDAYDDNAPSGGTAFHVAAQQLRDEAALQDSTRPNAGIFVTDGAPDQAFTTREAVRLLCDLKTRSGSPVATYSVGYQDGNQQLNSLIAAAGGTGSCCFASDGTCDTEREASPCEMYRYEQDNGQRIVNELETWLQTYEPVWYAGWREIVDSHAARGHTKDSYRTGTVADDLDMALDFSMFAYANLVGNPDNIDCDSNAGNPNATGSNPGAFYRYMICEMEDTLSYVVRQRYDWGNDRAEEYDSSEYTALKRVQDDSAFLDNDYVCTGSKFADDENALYAELQAILSSMECTYPLSLLDGMDSAPQFTDATRVKLYVPSLGTVVDVPHTDDTDAQRDFKDELCNLGIANCASYQDDGWSFSNEGRTSVKLTPELCDLTKTDLVEQLTTQVCRMCDPDLVGTSCDYVACTPSSPPSNPTTGDTAYTADGEMCEFTEFPCADNPDDTCSGWTKTGRCGMGAYACDADGFPYCEQVRSRMPEICNNVDDDCDGSIDDLSENLDEWDEPQYSIAGEEYDGWYCSYRDTCTCPPGHTDSVGGTKADGADEFTKMMEHQQQYGECQCGEGMVSGENTAYEPTRTWAPSKPEGEPQAACSAAGDNAPTGLGAAIAALLFGLVGWRRRRDG